MASETSLSENLSAVSDQWWAITNTGGAPILAGEKGGGQAALGVSSGSGSCKRQRRSQPLRALMQSFWVAIKLVNFDCQFWRWSFRSMAASRWVSSRVALRIDSKGLVCVNDWVCCLCVSAMAFHMLFNLFTHSVSVSHNKEWDFAKSNNDKFHHGIIW